MTRSMFTVLKLIAGGTLSVWPFRWRANRKYQRGIRTDFTLTGPGRPKLAKKEV